MLAGWHLARQACPPTASAPPSSLAQGVRQVALDPFLSVCIGAILPQTSSFLFFPPVSSRILPLLINRPSHHSSSTVKRMGRR